MRRAVEYIDNRGRKSNNMNKIISIVLYNNWGVNFLSFFFFQAEDGIRDKGM